MQGAEVTVVIPTRNRPNLVQRSISSALTQGDTYTSVIVVDDGSDEHVTELMSRMASSRIRVVRHANNRGVSEARNAGLDLVETPWIAFLDDDDYWAPNKLQLQLEALRRTPGTGWACGGAVHVDAESHPMYWRRPPAARDALDMLSRIGGIPGGGSGVLASTRLAREVGGFDLDLSILADWDFYFRLARRSPVAVVDRPLVGYFVHPDSMYHDPLGLERELAALELKYHDSVPALRPDRSFWALQLVAMALRAPDFGAVRQLLSGGFLRGTRPRPVLAVVANRLRRNRLGTRTCPPEWRGECLAWLDQPIPGSKGP